MEKVIDLEAEDFLTNVLKTGKIKKEKVDRKEEKENREEDDCYEIDHDEFYGKLFINTSSDADEEVVVLGTKGLVALRDFPHPRHLCGNFPFDSTPHENYCSSKCFCVLCEVVAPCSNWNGSDVHCNAISNNRRKNLGSISLSVQTSLSTALTRNIANRVRKYQIPALIESAHAAMKERVPSHKT